GEAPAGADAEPRRTLARSHVGAPHGAHDHREGLGEHELVVAHAGEGGPAAARGQPRLFREAAVHVDAERGAGEAEVAIALVAQRTGAAREVRLDGHALPGPESLHAGAHRGDIADEFMAHHEWIGHGTIAAPD